MALKMFEDDDDRHDEDLSKIEIDEEYARRFEHNKKREDLQRYEELKKRGLIKDDEEESEESESEEEEDEDILGGGSKDKDLKFIEALIKVRNQDPSLKNGDVKLFESDKSENESDHEGVGEGTKRKEKKKKLHLKDVVAKHLIEEGPEFDDEKEDFDKKKKVKTYDEEQEEMRKAFLDAVEAAEEDDADDGDFLKVKENKKGGSEEGDNNEEFVKKLDDYFGRDAELDENKKFLKDFFMKKLWVDRDEKGKKPLIDRDEFDDLEKDEEEIERQEEYETNYRYEENAGDRVMGHSRKVEGSVRKNENARKEQRKSKEERMKIAEMERHEELKHLKNLKKKEIKEKMKKLLAIAGFKDGEEFPLSAKDLEGEFDPEEYDRMMKAAFDESYYEAEDSDFGSDEDDEKPNFEKEDELLGLPKNWDVIKPGEGFQAAREKSLKHQLDDISEGGDEEEGEENDSDGDDDHDSGEEGKEEEQPKETEESKRKRKRKASLVQRAKEALMEEYYKLDYEDTIGDLKTRFKYAKIKPNRYGLSAQEILEMDDRELNQYVSLKKIAPYREKEWKVHNSKRHQLKQKNKEPKKKGDHHRNEKKKNKRTRDDKKPTSEIQKVGDQNTHQQKKPKDETGKSAMVTDEKANHKPEPEGDTSGLSKGAKRRRRQSEYKLPHSRLVAYGKV